MSKYCQLLDGRVMIVWSVNEEDGTVDVFPRSGYDIEVDVPETIKEHLVLYIDSDMDALALKQPVPYKSYLSDLAFQFVFVDELDWVHFCDVIEKARAASVREGIEFTPNNNEFSLSESLECCIEKLSALLWDSNGDIDWGYFEMVAREARAKVESNVRNRYDT